MKNKQTQKKAILLYLKFPHFTLPCRSSSGFDFEKVIFARHWLVDSKDCSIICLKKWKTWGPLIHSQITRKYLVCVNTWGCEDKQRTALALASKDVSVMGKPWQQCSRRLEERHPALGRKEERRESRAGTGQRSQRAGQACVVDPVCCRAVCRVFTLKIRS